MREQILEALAGFMSDANVDLKNFIRYTPDAKQAYSSGTIREVRENLQLARHIIKALIADDKETKEIRGVI